MHIRHQLFAQAEITANCTDQNDNKNGDANQHNDLFLKKPHSDFYYCKKRLHNIL